MYINVSPTSHTCEKASSSYQRSSALWELTQEEIALYTIDSMGVRFSRSSDGYGFIASDSSVSPSQNICYYENYGAKSPGEESVYLSIPATYYENKTSGNLLLMFRSTLYRQVYQNITLEITLKARATPSTGTSNVVDVGQSQTITLQNTTLSQVQHKITWQYGSVTGTTTTAQGVQTSSWAVPSASIGTVCSANPSGTVVTGTAVIETYLGSDQTASNLIGSTSIDTRLNIPEDSNTRPVSTSNIVISKQSGSPNVQNTYFQNFTDLTVTPSATTKYGATLVSCQVVVTNNNTVVFSQSIPLSKQTTFDHVVWAAGTNTVNIVVTDSRGFTNSNQAGQNVVLAAYSPPAISDVDVERYNLDTQQVDDEGTALKVTITASFDSTAGAASSDAYAAIVKEGSATVAQQSDIQNVLIVGDATHLTSPERTYRVDVTITDGYNVSSSVSVDIGTSTYTIYRMAGGKGVAFGQAANKYGVEVNEDWPFYTHGKEIQEMLLDYAHPVGSVIQTLDANFDPNEQWPWTQWGKLENVFLLGSGTRTVLDMGGQETQTDTFSFTIPQESIKLTANHLPKSTLIGYNTVDRWQDDQGQDIPNQRYGEANAPAGFTGRTIDSSSRQFGGSGNGLRAFLEDDNDSIVFGGQTVSASSTISTLPPYITVNIWVRAR